MNQPGRPREGDKPLLPTLEMIFGKSRATLKRYLAASEGPDGSESDDQDEVKRKKLIGFSRQLSRVVQMGETLSAGENLTDEERGKLVKIFGILDQAKENLEQLICESD